MKGLARFFGVLSLVLAISLSIGGLSPAPALTLPASSLLFDRGLPTSNLNDAAGENRSNVAVSYYIPPGDSTTSYKVFGDNFSIGSPGSTYHLDKITVWTVDDPLPTYYNLLGGLPGAISLVSTIASITPITYVGGASYQSGDSSYTVYQVDFTVDWTIAGGTLYQFFIDAPLQAYGEGFTTPFLHASDAGLSGSTQEGADDLLLLITLTEGSPALSSETYDPKNLAYWNKPSDANIQIYGTPAPLPGSLLLLGSGLLGLVGWRRFRKG